MIEVQVHPGAAADCLVPLVVRAGQAAIRQMGLDPATVDLTVVLADDAEVARLNQEFRGLAGPTDVLSFEAEDELDGLSDEMSAYVGDVIVSLDRARDQAAEAGHPLEHEVALLVAHGTLHLLGLDHAGDEERRHMWALQEEATREALSAAP